ncbi:MAG: metallophosphoesterase [Clostridia bacterium]|nr:metallophosphoesterase [Clostridia bacterium]
MADAFVPVLRFAAMSDLHFKDGDDNLHVERFYKGMKEIYEYCDSYDGYKGLDLLTINGDFANSGTEEQMLKLKKALGDCLRPNTGLLMTLASHEFGAGEQTALERFERIFELTPDTDLVVKGFHFVGLTTERGCRFGEGKVRWLRQTLEAAAAEDRSKPIFMFQHPHVTDTVYGSIDWGEKDLYPTLADFPQIIDFSGHSHAPINDPRNIHQQHFTSVGSGTLAYFELDEYDKYYGTVPPRNQGAQCLIVEVAEDNHVRILPYDILSGHFFPPVWDVEKPCDPETFVYTDARYLQPEKPFFPEGSFIDILTDEDSVVKITFSQASGVDEYVNYYKVIIRDSDGYIVRQRMLWSEYYFYDMPKTQSLPVEGLVPGRTYTCEIYAFGFWRNRSDKPITKEFTV